MARKAKVFKLTKEQQALAEENINLARREAWKLQRTTDIDYETLEGAAFEGLCKAAHRFDPGSGFKFSSLAVPTIRGELLHWIRDKTYAMRLSHKMRELWIKGRVKMYRGMTDEEVANHLDIELSYWLEIKSVCSGPPLELTDMSKATDSLEPEELNFGQQYIDAAERALYKMKPDDYQALKNYLEGNTKKIPMHAIKNCLDAFEKLEEMETDA